MTDQSCLIIGASHAAAQLAPSLRQQGWKGRIVVIGEEDRLPYHRPPLSKTFLAGEQSFDDILIRPAAAYEKAEVEFMSSSRVEAIDRDNKTVALSNGESLSYDKLALTVGSWVRKITLPGVDLGGVHYLRDAEDVERIRPYIEAGKKAVIVGGGYIGLETAAVLNKLGMQVTVLEMMPRILQRVTAPEVSAFYSRIHEEEGVTIVTDVAAKEIEGSQQVEAIVCQDGNRYPADLVIIGVGIVPNVELADAAGLSVDNGIVVDEYARTSDPDIVAAGDCTWHYNPVYDRHLRLESVQNATDQARTAAATICGELKAYNALPWFWSDQYDLKLQIAGLSQSYDDLVVRGDIDNSRSFAAFYLQQGKIIAVDAVNRPQEFMIGKRLITDGKMVDPEQLADDAIAMKEILAN